MLSVAAVHLVRRCVSEYVSGKMLVPCHSATSASVNWRVRRFSVGRWYVYSPTLSRKKNAMSASCPTVFVLLSREACPCCKRSLGTDKGTARRGVGGGSHLL